MSAPGRRTGWKPTGYEWLLLPTVLVLLAFFALPLATVMVYSLGRSEMVQGDIWLAVTGTNVVGPYIVKGAPIARAQPKEGAFMLLNTLALVNNAPLQEQGKDLINRMLSATAQLDMAKAALVGPTVRTAQVPAELRNLVPNGPEDASKMIRLDWSSLIKNRKALIDRWDKEISS